MYNYPYISFSHLLISPFMCLFQVSFESNVILKNLALSEYLSCSPHNDRVGNLGLNSSNLLFLSRNIITWVFVGLILMPNSSLHCLMVRRALWILRMPLLIYFFVVVQIVPSSTNCDQFILCRFWIESLWSSIACLSVFIISGKIIGDNKLPCGQPFIVSSIWVVSPAYLPLILRDYKRSVSQYSSLPLMPIFWSRGALCSQLYKHFNRSVTAFLR